MTGTCRFCGSTRRRLHKDHIAPRALGGVDDPTNWQYLCANCHEDKTYAERQTEWKAFARNSMLGRRWTAEQRKRQGDRQRGKVRGPYKNKKPPLTAEQREKIRAAWTPEMRAAARARNTGRVAGPCPEERKKKIATASKGKERTAKQRARHSERVRAWWGSLSAEDKQRRLRAARERAASREAHRGACVERDPGDRLRWHCWTTSPTT